MLSFTQEAFQQAAWSISFVAAFERLGVIISHILDVYHSWDF